MHMFLGLGRDQVYKWFVNSVNKLPLDAPPAVRMITRVRLTENTEDARHGIHLMGDKPTEVITCDHTRNVVPAHRYLVPDRLNMMHTVSLIIILRMHTHFCL